MRNSSHLAPTRKVNKPVSQNIKLLVECSISMSIVQLFPQVTYIAVLQKVLTACKITLFAIQQCSRRPQ